MDYYATSDGNFHLQLLDEDGDIIGEVCAENLAPGETIAEFIISGTVR